MEKHHHRHHLKNLFRRDKDLLDLELRSGSHLNLSKIFHKDRESTSTPVGNAQAAAPEPLSHALSLHRSEGTVVGKVEKGANGKLSIVPNLDSSAAPASPATPVAGHSRMNSAQQSPHTPVAAQTPKKHDESPSLRLSRSSSDAGGFKGVSTPLAVSLKRNNTNGTLAGSRQPVRRSETMPFNNRPHGALIGLASNVNRKNSHHGHHEKIKYNPYGINKLDLNQIASHSTSFYLKGGPDLGGRVVANPVADPNDYLPEDLHEDHINLLEDFDYENLDKKIGDGGSGDVRIVTLNTNKKKHFALKKFSLFSKETDEEFYKRAAKEYIISRRVASLRHAVSTYALLRIQSHGNMTRGWGMVMEFCNGGDLFNMIVRLGWKRTPLVERYCIFKQIAYGVKFLHEHDIVHRDLKPENILLDHNGLAKLCDFGVSDWGHEEVGNFESPVKLSTAYVGSPPYSPPEVMILKELSLTELKKHAYDPFKMDHWSLGMLLFCLVYSGVPFQLATVHDNNFRDYKFNRDRFCSDNPSFKNNSDFAKGPGSEFKWASLFQSSGAARVAWKLCDPSSTKRYDLDNLFADPWFKSLEMCIYEHPDQSVDPIVYHSANPSAASSAQNSRAPSRKNTISGHSAHDESGSGGGYNPIRSMLDMSSLSKEIDDDNASVKSSSLLDHTPLKIKQEDRVDRSGSEVLIHLIGSNGSIAKVRSMLDFSPTSEKPPLPSVAETDPQLKAKHSPLLEVLKEVTSRSGKEPDATEIEALSLDKNSQVPQPINTPHSANLSYFAEKLNDADGKIATTNFFDDMPIRPHDEGAISSDGVCDQGYKIKKHSHMGVTNVHYSGSRRK